MKSGKQNIDISELFRGKLENAEVMPDASVRSNLMRKVARREFLRFNPSSLNIYYILGIMTAGLVAALVLSSGPSKNENNRLQFPLKVKDKFVDTNKLYVPVEQQPRKKPGNQDSGQGKQETEKSAAELILKSPGQSAGKTLPQNNIEIKRPYVGDFFSGKGLFTAEDTDKNKLQGGIQQVADLIKASVTEGCPPLKIRFTNKLSSYDSCRWSFGDGGYSNAKDPEWIFDVDGEYKVNLTVFSTNGSIITSSAVIKVHPRPAARFEISDSDTEHPGKNIRFINYSSNAVRFKWYFGDGNSSDSFEPKYQYSKSGNYNVMLVVSSDYGCKDSLVVVNAFTGNNYFLTFPNAFIPNPGGPTGGYYSLKSDESAQVFHPEFSGVSDYQLKIFSKIGILIFESNDINVGWDGYFKGLLCEPGVYIWKVRGSFLSGEPFIKMGDVILLKN